MTETKQKLLIIDSNAIIHRAYHALPPLTNKDGVLVNAVYGFCTILIKTIKELKPDYIIATFDLPGGTFRHQMFTEYKAQRTKQPDEFYAQIPIVKKVLTAFNIPIFEKSGFEADDLIGTIAHLKSVDNKHIDSIIMTGDQDTLQLVDNNTFVLSPHKGFSETILYNETLVKEKYNGLRPDQLIDYKGLRGDPSDNIPGVHGIGPKGATDLLNSFGTIENIYQNIDSDKIRDRIRELLKEQKDNALLSKKLATIITDVPVDFDLNACRFTGFNEEALITIFQELNFKKLLSTISSLTQKPAETTQGDLFGSENKAQIQKDRSHQKYTLVNDKKTAQDFVKKLTEQNQFCFDTETTSVRAFEAELVGISFCWHKNEAYYLPKNIVELIKSDLQPIFANPDIKKIGHNLKYDIEILMQSGLPVSGIYFDSMIASYILNPGTNQHSLDTLAFVELGYRMQSIEDLIGKGKEQITMDQVAVEKVSWYSCEDADFTWQLYQKSFIELDKQGMLGLMTKIDMPLVHVLAEMEKNGIKVDTAKLKKLSDQLTKKIAEIELEAYKMAGSEFNLGSPKQLKEVLFEKLNISSSGIKKTKTGISTSADVLEKLAHTHPIIDLILSYRELSKLKNTYLDALPLLINKKDGRIHTSFNQTVTATGRLSSSDPNLQNIPIRSEIGEQIRQSFIAEPGCKIIKADYSQIELRIVASLANDPKMLSAFHSKTDIHTQTAAAINEVSLDKVDKNMRRQAKEVNFGVLYGMGAWGLSERTGITPAEAQKFIAKYFATFKEVKRYIDETIILAKERGYVETLYGRRRYLPEINSSVVQIQKSAERMAVNMPIQGTAADMIKLAMIRI
ncbi:MAG: DNA polymerase I, partial [bacterium]